MPLAARKQTFGLENCRDMLAKLEWEIERYREASPHDAASLTHIAFNAAVTAWQLADWVCADITPAQLARLGVADGNAFKRKVLRESRAVYLCRQVATASKHAFVSDHFDETVDSVVNATDGDVEINDEAIFATPPVWALAIQDGEKIMPVMKVFEGALDYWTKLIFENGIAR
ncbi:MAG: hypothetical protein NBV67_00230 [Tagaea sp.]|nr:hypothetical protein [Tagaea sp.]